MAQFLELQNNWITRLNRELQLPHSTDLVFHNEAGPRGGDISN